MTIENSLTIREFRFPEDYPAAYDLWANAGTGIHLRLSDEIQEIEKKIQRDPDLFLLAEREGQVIGVVLGGFDGRRGMMYHLAVSDSNRRQGVAAALVDELETRLRQKGCLRYYLLMTPDNPALQFYQQRGWETLDLLALAKNLN